MAERHVQRCIFTIAEWKSGGRRRFVKEVSAAALGELEEVDYMEYDLSPLRRLIGDVGRRLCAQLAAADRAAYLLRLTAMKADLTLLCRKAQALAEVSTTAELVYRIDFYEHAFEVKIITGGRLTAWFMKGT